jgi:hypothetical protein
MHISKHPNNKLLFKVSNRPHTDFQVKMKEFLLTYNFEAFYLDDQNEILALDKKDTFKSIEFELDTDIRTEWEDIQEKYDFGER